MGIKYGSLNVDERYSPIIEPNLYHNSIFVPGVTYTDKYQTGPAGQIYVHKLTGSAVEPGTPGRDFSDEASADTLIQIALNNNYQKSKKIYGVQAAAVDIALANEQLAAAIAEVREGWNKSGVACLVHEGTAATDTAAIEDAKAALIATRKEAVSKKAAPNVVICSPDFYAQLLTEVGTDFTPVRNDRVAETGAIGYYFGFLIIESSIFAEASAKYYDSTGAQQTSTLTGVDFVMYNSEALSIINNFEVARIIDSENFAGSKAQTEMNTGFKVTNADSVWVRKTAG